MASPTTTKPANKLSGDLARVLPHLQLDEQGRSALAGCRIPSRRWTGSSGPDF